MRRTASELLNELENRIARLENRSANQDHPTIARFRGKSLSMRDVFKVVDALNETQSSKGKALYALYSIVIGGTYGKNMADGGVRLHTPKEKPTKASENLKKHFDLMDIADQSLEMQNKFLDAVQSHINVINSEIAKIKKSL
tara:strand:- start:192 stop:617 length:426 start_codon:yes stop_codon:yes gene_type:complete